MNRAVIKKGVTLSSEEYSKTLKYGQLIYL